MTVSKPSFSPSLRLWQLISPTLPIGAYAYSTGLEYAVEAEWVTDEETAKSWIVGQLENTIAHLDVPLFLRLYESFETHNISSANQWNQILLASRETSELKLEDLNLGAALLKVLTKLDCAPPKSLTTPLSYAASFAYGCSTWQIEQREAAMGLLWSWGENQVSAAMKLLPLGQTAGQQTLTTILEAIPSIVENSIKIKDEDIGFSAPGVSMASALHETQYSRLFRS